MKGRKYYFVNCDIFTVTKYELVNAAVSISCGWTVLGWEEGVLVLGRASDK